MFNFQLEPVLRLRAWVEEQKQLAFAERQRILMEEIGKKTRLKNIRGQYFEAMREEVAKEEISVTDLSFYQSYIFWIERAISRQDEKILRERKLTDEAKEKLLDAKKNKEVLVRTKDRAWKRYRHAEAMRDQKVLDEISTVKYARRARGLDRLSVNA
ncbi:MAG: flagellar export protein FliJ [bacterium]